MDRFGFSRVSKNTRRILVVDSNADTATALAYLLEIMGHQALYLFDARHALTKVDEFRPHIAFVELGMRTLDGVGVARLLREHYARHELRLIAVSAYGDARTRDESMTADFDGYLAKPVKEQDVETILSVVFDQRLG